MLSLLESAVQHQNSSLRDRLKASFLWIKAARRLRPESISSAYSASLALLARISIQRSTLESQQESFSSKFYDIPKSLASDAASSAIEIGMVDAAIEFLEQGRAFMWSRMKGYRHPLLRLYDSHPELAKRFENLSTQLERHATTSFKSFDTFGTKSTDFEAQRLSYQRLLEEWNKVVEEIRNVDGFQDFLKPVRFSALRKAAAEGDRKSVV